MAHGQAEALLPLVDRTMRQASLPASAVELVAVTTGPGSFTGIRVGIAAARGISLGIGVPLIGVTVFEAVAATARDAGREMRFLLVAIESRRADLYVQLFDRARCPLGGPAAVLPAALAEMVRAAAGEHALVVAGDAAQRAVAALATGGVASVVLDGEPPVLGAVHAALRRWRQGEQRQGGQDSPVRPLYLRPPDVTLAGAPVPPGRS